MANVIFCALLKYYTKNSESKQSPIERILKSQEIDVVCD